MNEKKSRGRPPKKLADKKSRIVSLKMTVADHAAIKIKAGAERLTMTDFLVRRGLGIR